MNILIIFVEKTSYNIARIHKVYEKNTLFKCRFVYCNENVSGHQTGEEYLPANCTVLSNNKVVQLLKILKEEKYDFIQINGYSDKIRMAAIMYAKIKNIPYAIETDTQLNIPENHVKRLIKNCLLKFIFRKNAYGFAGGTRQTELFRYYGMPKENITIMPMSVDTDAFRDISCVHSKEYYKEKYGFKEKKIVLYIGRFETVKNLNILIKAFSMVKRKRLTCELCLVGKGSQKKVLEDYCEKLNIKSNVHFFTYKLMPELAEFYSMADVFVLPSAFEPWGLVVNEALACKTPVIASDKVGSGNDLIVNDVNGDIFESGNAEQLSMLIDKWIYSKNSELGIDIIEKWNFRTYYNIWTQRLGEICR